MKWKKTETANAKRDKVTEEPHQAEAYVCQRYIEDPLLIGGEDALFSSEQEWNALRWFFFGSINSTTQLRSRKRLSFVH